MKAAIYWDYQNVQIKSSTSSNILVDKIIEFAREKGELGTLRAYANWSSPAIKAETAQNLVSAGFELIHVPLTRKNAVDLVISTDLGKAAMASNFQYFIIITSDGDFIPALSSLRRTGKNTVVIANPDVANERLQLAADDFLPLSRFRSQPEVVKVSATVLPSKADNEVEAAKDPQDEKLEHAITLLRTAVIESTNEGQSLRYSSIAAKLYDLEPTLDFKKIQSLPAKKFQALVKEAVDRKAVFIRNTEGWNELFVPEIEETLEDTSLEQQASSSGRQLNEGEIRIIGKWLSELESETDYSFSNLHTQLRYQRNEVEEFTMSNSELKQLLISMIETEIFRKQTEFSFQISPL